MSFLWDRTLNEETAIFWKWHPISPFLKYIHEWISFCLHQNLEDVVIEILWELWYWDIGVLNLNSVYYFSILHIGKLSCIFFLRFGLDFVVINIMVVFDLGIVGLESINNHLHNCDFGCSMLVGQHPIKSLSSVSPSVCLSVCPSLSFLLIGSLDFSDIVHYDSWLWYLVPEKARFLKKNW